PPQDRDRQLLDFLNASGRDFVLIATKSDRLSNNQLLNALKSLAEAYPTATMIPFSAKTVAGRRKRRDKSSARPFKESSGGAPYLSALKRSGSPQAAGAATAPAPEAALP